MSDSNAVLRKMASAGRRGGVKIELSPNRAAWLEVAARAAGMTVTAYITMLAHNASLDYQHNNWPLSDPDDYPSDVAGVYNDD